MPVGTCCLPPCLSPSLPPCLPPPLPASLPSCRVLQFSSRRPPPGRQDGTPTPPARLVSPLSRLLLRLGGHLQAEGQVQPERLQRCGEEEGGDRGDVPRPQEHRLQRRQHVPAARLLRLPGVSGTFSGILNLGSKSSDSCVLVQV